MPYAMMHGMQMMDVWGLPLLGASPTQTTKETLVPETQNIAQFRQQYGPWLTAVKPLLEAGAFQQAFATYPFLHPATVPWTSLSRPIAACTVALVTTGGVYLKASQEPFDAANIEGDMSYRVFSNQVQPQKLGIAHTHYPHHFAERDLNTILPLEHLHAFAREGPGALRRTCTALRAISRMRRPLLRRRLPTSLRSSGRRASMRSC